MSDLGWPVTSRDHGQYCKQACRKETAVSFLCSLTRNFAHELGWPGLGGGAWGLADSGSGPGRRAMSIGSIAVHTSRSNSHPVRHALCLQIELDHSPASYAMMSSSSSALLLQGLRHGCADHALRDLNQSARNGNVLLCALSPTEHVLHTRLSFAIVECFRRVVMLEGRHAAFRPKLRIRSDAGAICSSKLLCANSGWRVLC